MWTVTEANDYDLSDSKEANDYSCLMWTVIEANDYSTLVWCEPSKKLMIILHLSDVNRHRS